MLCHLCFQVHAGVIYVSHCCPVLRFGLCKVLKGFLDTNQVVGSVVTLAVCLLPFLDFGLCFYEVVLGGRSGFIVLIPPYPTLFGVISCFRYQYIGNTDKLGLLDRLACCCGKVRALVETLNEALKRLLHVVCCADYLSVCSHFLGGIPGVFIVQVCDELHC